jgi:hypothetical protein
MPVLGMLILCVLLSHQIVGKVCICYLSLCSIFLLHNLLLLLLLLLILCNVSQCVIQDYKEATVYHQHSFNDAVN